MNLKINLRKWHICLVLIAAISLSHTALAAPSVSPADFGSNGLATYLQYAKDANMFRAMVALDLAEGRSIKTPNAAYLKRMASSMSLSPKSGVKDYINYYTSSSSLKAKADGQSARLAGIVSVISNKAFPLAANIPIWYIDNWQAYRGDDGERRHEGIDITCPMGMSVRSMSAGTVEKVGWNTLGGWRVGIRGKDGMYYYYAHLSGFASGIREGAKVALGQVIGYSGDSGNGPEGTTGRYEPHLHIGVYTGPFEDLEAFNPYGIIIWAERNRW